MNLLGNLIWLIFGGFLSAIGYVVAGFFFVAPSSEFRLAFNVLK